MNVYGARQDDKGVYVGVIVRMLNALDAGQHPVIHGDGSQAYDFVDVRDCARANVLAMEADTSDRYYNVGTGIKTSIAEVAGQLGAEHPEKLAAHFEACSRPFVRNRVGATARALKEIGFSAEIPLQRGLRDMIKWRDLERSGICS
jgi:UDP-glucose 4-epimerase